MRRICEGEEGGIDQTEKRLTATDDGGPNRPLLRKLNRTRTMRKPNGKTNVRKTRLPEVSE